MSWTPATQTAETSLIGPHGTIDPSAEPLRVGTVYQYRVTAAPPDGVDEVRLLVLGEADYGEGDAPGSTPLLAAIAEAKPSYIEALFTPTPRMLENSPVRIGFATDSNRAWGVGGELVEIAPPV